MYQSSKGDNSEQPKINHITDSMIMGEMADSILNILQTDFEEDEEPLEVYMHHLKLRLHRDVKSFRHRFVEGYEILMGTLHMMP